MPIFCRAILTARVGHTELALLCDQVSYVDLYIQDYKSLCAAVTICAIQTHIDRQHFDQLI